MKAKGILSLTVFAFALLLMGGVGFDGIAIAGCSEDNDPKYKAAMDDIRSKREAAIAEFTIKYSECCAKPSIAGANESVNAPKRTTEAQLRAELTAKQAELQGREDKAYEDCKKRSTQSSGEDYSKRGQRCISEYNKCVDARRSKESCNDRMKECINGKP